MATTNDHEIMIGTTKTGLRLARDSSGKALYQVSEDVPAYNQQLEVAQKDYTGGHGQYTLKNQKRFFDGQSIDTTQLDRIMLGPQINEVYVATTQKDNYTSGNDADYAVYSTNSYGEHFVAGSSYTLGSVLLFLGRVGNPGPVYVYFHKCTNGTDPDYTLNVGYTSYVIATLDGNNLPETDAWMTIPLPAMSVVSATAYAIRVSAPSGSAANYVKVAYATVGAEANANSFKSVPSGTIPTITQYAANDILFDIYSSPTVALASTPTCFLWASTAGVWLCADNSAIYRYVTGGWIAATTTVAGVVDLKEYNGQVFAATGSGDNYWYSTDGDTWTECTLTDHHAIKFLSAPNADGTANTFWKLMTTNELTSSTNPVNGGSQFGSPAYIGDTSANVTNVFLCGDELAVGRTDNLYHYDTNGGIHAKMNELQNQRSPDNFKYVQNWKGATYFSLVTGIGEISGSLTNGILDQVSPLAGTGDIDKVGVVRGMAADTDYLYVAMLEGTVTHIYKGRPTASGWSWCPWVYLGTNQCVTIAVAQHSPTDRRLWFGYGTHTGYVQITDNPTTDPMARFAPSGFVRMSWVYGTNPYWDKMFQTIITEVSANVLVTVGGVTQLPSGVTVQPKYRKDNESAMTNLTALIQTTPGITQTSLAAALSCKRIQFELDLATSDATLTPQVRAFIAKGAEKPETHRVHDVTYYGGTRLMTALHTLRTTLRSARTTTGLIKFADLRFTDVGTSGTAGTDYVYVIMQPGYPREVETKHELNREPELGMAVRWQEITT